jgi:glycine/D-amino acid oxidase-like deaminating enzyme
MTRDLSRLTSGPFGVLAIGGGIHGLAVAYDAAQRGYAAVDVCGALMARACHWDSRRLAREIEAVSAF